MGKAEYKVKGGKLIRVQLYRRGNKIDKIKITGDFFLHPEDLIEELEKTLLNHPLNETDLTDAIGDLIEQRKAILLGASPEDFAKCIVMAGEKDG